MNLSKRQQDVLAVLMQKVGRFVRALDKDEESVLGLYEDMVSWALLSNVTPQEIDVLYEKFHRQGANA